MTISSQSLANMLAQSPPNPDPGFRVDVFMRITERAQRQAARRRAFRYFAISALIGVAVPLAKSSGLMAIEGQPLLVAACAVGLAYGCTIIAIEGTDAALARSRAILRFLRA